VFAFVDETGNTGGNLLDDAQPDFFTAALITKTDFDLVHAGAVQHIARRFGDGPLHGKELGLARVEEVASELRSVFKRADAYFYISRVEKRYLLATKIFDTFFDSGENAAVPWHVYNVRPLRITIAFKVASLVSEATAREFWAMLLENNEAKAKAALPGICQSILNAVGSLPDQRSREIVTSALEWARDRPDTIHLHIDSRQARKGHMPNMVAFANLLEGLEHRSKKWDRPVKRITHDRQSEFDKVLKGWHEMYSHASPEPVQFLAGETVVFQRVVGSEFEVKSSSESAGIQAIDVVLWLFLQHSRGARLPEGCWKLLKHAFKRAWISDFSFTGVERAIDEKFGEIMRTPISAEQEIKVREMLDFAEKRRQQSMEDYEKDGIVPYMRQVPTKPTQSSIET
jgi:hypothetical protein